IASSVVIPSPISQLRSTVGPLSIPSHLSDPGRIAGGYAILFAGRSVIALPNSYPSVETGSNRRAGVGRVLVNAPLPHERSGDGLLSSGDPPSGRSAGRQVGVGQSRS